MNRRLFIGTLGAGALGTVAGCVSGLADDVATFSATPARVSEDAAAEADYKYQGTRERIDSEVVGGQDVEVTSYISVYDRAIDLTGERFGGDALKASVFGVIATPQVSVDGEDFDPVGDLSNRELAERVQSHYSGIEVDRAVGGRALQALGQRFSFQSYEGIATLQAEYDVSVHLDVAQRDHEDDHVVVAAVYPTDSILSEGSEQGRIDTLTRGLEQYEGIDVKLESERSGE
ncbi:DUF6517 family protein [Natrinema halophilum]|uniref:Lipoprotein n=1 Tax=Natrinema halophilum TaxID=1699371 RepID=A0A7D5GFM8_9EURY|nr:DUF6517 family protein [Natrinema halophilum]QLG47714.1 DUF6517 family protein [Natrinema halophilum]